MQPSNMKRNSDLLPGWIRKGVPIWVEEKDPTGKEVNEYLAGFIQELLPGNKVKVLISSNNSEKTVDIALIHQRTLEHKVISDLAEIPILNDAELMAHLELMYNKDEIFCYCGPSLIVVNPYKKIERMLSQEKMDFIQDCLESEKLKKAPPHNWTVGAIALSRLKKSPKNQAICINGESGAGKTVSTKMCLEFLTNLEKKHLLKGQEDLSDQIMACNPILEAFGNSKTMRNDNSSRFGKYVKLFYDLKQHNKILGATMENYLLEKSRVISPAKQERSFHIFYAMCRFMPINQQKKYLLTNTNGKCDLSYFNILKQTEVYESPKINDKEFFEDVVKAFERLEFTEEEIDSIWRILAAILYLGNIKVDSSKYEDGKTPCKIVENEDFKNVLQLLGCDKKVLEEGLTIRIRQVGSTIMKSPHKPENITDFIGALSKDMYNRMFNWIFKKMNTVLMGDLDPHMIMDMSKKPDHINTIGLLDIFGFEIFEKNYLEQLFINYANERLQGLYIDHIFKNECKFFIQQGLEKYVELIKYEDNLDLIKVLDRPLNPIGIFALTNQNSRLNKPDAQLMEDVKKSQKENEKKGLITFHRMKKEIFYIKHTARDVEYTVTGFIEKNKDEVSPDIITAVETCKPSIVKIYNEIIDNYPLPEEKETNQNAKFLAYKFTKNMDELMQELNSSNCHFIRCVKPNEIKRSSHWVSYLVLKQITYMGLLNSLKIRKQNYVFRFKYDEFYFIYKDLDLNKEGAMNPKQLQELNVDYKILTQNLLQSLNPKPSETDLLIGSTKILINEHYKIYLDNILKEKQKEKREAIALIVSHYEENMKRKKILEYFKTTSNSLTIAKLVLTGVNARVNYVHFKKQIQLIRKMQANFRRTIFLRNEALKSFRMKTIIRFFYLYKIAEEIKLAKKIGDIFEFVKIRLKYLVYKSRKRTIRLIVMGIFNKAWNIVKFKKIDIAASDLQRTFRSYLLRKQQEKHIQELKKKLENFRMNNAAILVQSHTRRFLVETRMERVEQAVRTIQRYYKSRVLRSYFIKLRKSAIIIQRTFKMVFKKQKIMKKKFNEVINRAGNGIDDVMYLEYKNIFHEKSFFSGNDIVDYNYQKYLLLDNFSNKKCQNMIPNPPVVELINKAKLFSLVVDFSVMTDISLFYGKTWGYHFKKLLSHLDKNQERLLHIEIGETCTFAISDDLKVFSWGANDLSQLCRKTEAMFGCSPKEVINLSKNKAGQLSLGKNNGKMVCQNGELFTWGDNSLGELGLKNSKHPNTIWVKNDVGKIESVASDENKTYLLTEKGELLQYPIQDSLGDWSFRKIGLLHIRQKITEMACGDDFLLLKSSQGKLYSKGDNSFGQLGLGDYVKRDSPTNIKHFINAEEKVLDFSCGYKHVIARTNANRIYVWGDNRFHQLGIQESENSNKPVVLTINKEKSFSDRIKSVCAGAFSSYLLMDNNYFFFFGRTGRGTLSTPFRFPYEQIFFDEKIGNNFVPLKICSSWSRVTNVVYIVFLDFRNCKNVKKQLQEKISKLLLKDWKKDNLLPTFNEQLNQYVQSKNFKQFEKNGIVDITIKPKKEKSLTKLESPLKTENIPKKEKIDKEIKKKEKPITQYENSKNVLINKLQVNEKNEVTKNENDIISKQLYKMMEKKNNENQEKKFKTKKEALLSLLKESFNKEEVKALKNTDEKMLINNNKLKLSQNNVKFINNNNLEEKPKSMVKKSNNFNNIKEILEVEENSSNEKESDQENTIKEKNIKIKKTESVFKESQNSSPDKKLNFPKLKNEEKKNQSKSLSKRPSKATTSINTKITKNNESVKFYNKNDFLKKSKSKSKIKEQKKPVTKSSKLILKGLNNKMKNEGILTTERDRDKSIKNESMRSIDEKVKNSKVLIESNIFDKVEIIMKKDPKKWTNIDREIMNSYIKFTKGLVPKN